MTLCIVKGEQFYHLIKIFAQAGSCVSVDVNVLLLCSTSHTCVCMCACLGLFILGGLCVCCGIGMTTCSDGL